MSINKLKEVSPIELLTAERFDIAAKYLYARLNNKGINSSWHEKVYLEHIKVFNGYIETDGTEKYGAAAFLDSFNETIASINERGFNQSESTLPVNDSGTLIDGAHRVAAALLFDSVVSIRSENIEKIKYDSSYFLTNGLNEKWADSMALEYCRIKINTFIVILYPAAVGKKVELQNLLNKYGNIVYKKSINFSKNGSVNLIKNIYHTEEWLGDNKNNYSGARDKANYCFSTDGVLNAFLYESKIDNVLVLKNEIRELYGVSNHSVHINDRHEESIWLSKLLFNKNTIDYLNTSPVSENTWVKKLISEYKSILYKNSEDPEEYCIDGGAVLSVHGIRNTRDLDYISSSRNEIISGFKEISCHNGEERYFSNTLDELIYNPENHFYVCGMKAITLEVLRDFKKNRAEEKDIKDIALIDSYINTKNKGEIYTKDRISYIKELKNIKSHLRLIALKCRFYIYIAIYKIKRMIV